MECVEYISCFLPGLEMWLFFFLAICAVSFQLCLCTSQFQNIQEFHFASLNYSFNFLILFDSDHNYKILTFGTFEEYHQILDIVHSVSDRSFRESDFNITLNTLSNSQIYMIFAYLDFISKHHSNITKFICNSYDKKSEYADYDNTIYSLTRAFGDSWFLFVQTNLNQKSIISAIHSCVSDDHDQKANNDVELSINSRQYLHSKLFRNPFNRVKFDFFYIESWLRPYKQMMLEDEFIPDENSTSTRNTSTQQLIYLEENAELIETVSYTTQLYDISDIEITTEEIIREPAIVYAHLNDAIVICQNPVREGLIEFSDMGANPIPSFANPYVHSPGHRHVAGVARFGFIDAYGARLVNGVLEIVIPYDVNTTNSNSEVEEEYSNHGPGRDTTGFRTKENTLLQHMTLYYEPASFGLGFNDSTSLASPLYVKAISPVERKSTRMKEADCYCDVYLEKTHFVFGLTNYPQYGHVMFNGLSNILATLWRKNISKEDLIFHYNLQRHTRGGVEGVNVTEYSLHWDEKYAELFRALATSVLPWSDKLDASKLLDIKICFERIMVGSLPHLDHLNATATNIHTTARDGAGHSEGGGGDRLTSEASSNLWMKFRDTLFSLFFPLSKDGSAQTEQTGSDADVVDAISTRALNELLAEKMHQKCIVTFIVRTKSDYSRPSTDIASSFHQQQAHVPFTPSSRRIDNLFTLESIARHHYNCSVQRVLLNDMSVIDQMSIFYHSTLIIAADGTALLNSVFMKGNYNCSTILQIEMWRKPGIVKHLITPNNSLEHRKSRNWITYRIPLNRTRWHSNYGLPVHQRCLQTISRNVIDWVNLHDSCEFGDVILEDYLREGQSGSVDEFFFSRIVAHSIKRMKDNYHICR